MGYNPGYVDGKLVPNNAAYVPGVGLRKISEDIAGGVTFWALAGSDSLAAVQASGYISDATFKGLKVGDIVDVFSGPLLNEAANPPVGVTLGAVTFAATLGISSLFASLPAYQRMIVLSVTAGSTTTSGVGTLVPATSSSSSILANFRNLVEGGDFTTNPWQRATTFSAIANTLTYTADRLFAVGGASSSISVSKQAQTDVVSFSSSLRWGRGGGTNTATINLGQVVRSVDTVRMQGQVCTLSFWAKAGAQFSGVNSALNVLVATGTGTDEGAAGLVAATWTGYASLVLTPAQGSQAAQANVPQVITAAPVRYQFTFTVPATATELGLLFNYAPTGTNNTTDTVDFYGLQLEIGAGATPFEHRSSNTELALCQYHYWQVNEPAASGVVASGMNTTTAIQVFYIANPLTMFKAPTVTVVAGTFKTNQASAQTATTITAGTPNTVNAISVNGNSAGVAGQGTLLQGGGGAGRINVSADL